MVKFYRSEVVIKNDRATIYFLRWNDGAWHPLLCPFEMGVGTISPEQVSDIVARAHDDQVRLFEFVADMGMI